MKIWQTEIYRLGGEPYARALLYESSWRCELISLTPLRVNAYLVYFYGKIRLTYTEVDTITGEHSNAGPNNLGKNAGIYLVPGIVFCVYRRSCLLWSQKLPVYDICHLFHSFFAELLNLLEPRSRVGDRLPRIRLLCPQNGTAVLKGLTSAKRALGGQHMKTLRDSLTLDLSCARAWHMSTPCPQPLPAR